MSRLIEWESVCLVCLRKGENCCIFGEDNDSIVIADKIMKYSNLLIKRDTNQPHSICLQCLDDLNVASKFHRNYEQSESIIKALLNTNHQEFQIKDSWETSPTTVNPILVICIEDEVVDKTAVDDSCENTPCLNLEDDARTESKPTVEDRADSYIHSNTTELNNSKTGQNNKSIQKMNYKIPMRSRGWRNKLSEESSFTSGYKRPQEHPRIRPKQSTGVSLKICEICTYSFRYQYELDVHMRRHNNERPFSCNQCDKAFVTRAALQRHVRVHTGEKPYKCQYCDLRFADSTVKKNHESKHTGETPYKCPICENGFGYSKALMRHLQIHNSENKFTCKECGKRFTRKELFQKHINRHLNRDELNKSSEDTQNKSLEKEILQIQENTNSNEIIIKHEIVEDDLIGDNFGIGSTPCIDQEYGTVAEATNGDISKQSTGVSLKICEICNQDFRNQSALDVHMRRHNNVRPFSCNHCDKAFVTSSALRCHVRVHTGEKPYKCQYCDLRFSTNEVKKNHESDHTGEKPFKCPTCDKTFGYSKGLMRHLPIHYKSTCKEFSRENLSQKHANRHLNRVELNKSSENTQKKSFDKEIFQIQENTNSNEIIIKHEIVEDDLIGDNCDIESTSCIDVDNSPVSVATNGEIVSLKICEVCNYGCRYQYQLDAHMRRHNNERPFSCDLCDKGFVTRVELRRHLRVHTGEKPYKCQFCDLRFCSNVAKQNHESKHTGVKPYKCQTCDKGFGCAKVLMRHRQTHNKSTCKEFRREKLSQKHARRHLNRVEVNKSSEHTQKKSLDKEVFKIQANTNSNEIITQHEILEDDSIGSNCDSGSTSCIHLDNGAVSEASKGEVIQQSKRENPKHPRGEPKKSKGVSSNICKICNLDFRNQSALDVHMRRHSNRRPFSCDHFDKAIVTLAALRWYVKVHTVEKPYKCPTDMGKKPYKCPTCDKTFGYSQVLKRHLRIHNTENKFTCKECGKRFTRKEVFQKHVNRHLNRGELNKSSEHTQMKSLDKEMFQIPEDTNSNEINIKHEIVEDDLMGTNCDSGGTSCIDVDNGPVSQATNGEIPSHSTGVSLKICELCNLGFRYQSTLNVHMRHHNNQRRFICDHCDKDFVTGPELRRHMRVHTGEKSYKIFSSIATRSKRTTRVSTRV